MGKESIKNKSEIKTFSSKENLKNAFPALPSQRNIQILSVEEKVYKIKVCIYTKE